MNMLKQKKFKYGSLSVVLTAAVVALVIVFNVIVSALANHFYWYADMTGDEIYEISSLTHTLLSTVEDEFSGGNTAKIVFMAEEDRLQSTSDIYMKQVYEMAKKYEATFDYIDVDFVNPDLNPDKVKKYLQHSENATLNTTDVVFEGPGGKYKIVNYKSFLTTDSETGDVLGFSGERKITTTLMSLVSTDSIAYLTTGHGEETENLTEFTALLELVGFQVQTIDLQKEELDLEKGRLVVVNSPKTDFWGVNDPVNEIKKLDDFLDNFGHLMVFVDHEHQDGLGELKALMADWGIHYNRNLVIENADNSLSTDGRTVSATYPTDSSLGASLHASIRGLETVPKTVVSDTSTITIKEVTSANSHSNCAASPVLFTSDGARALNIDDSSTTSAAGEAILAISVGEQIIDSNTGEAYVNYVLAGGSSDFISDTYLRGGYANKDILYSALRAMVMDNVDVESANISFREYSGEALDITTGEANGNMILLSVIVPIVILAVGAVVFIKRRYL